MQQRNDPQSNSENTSSVDQHAEEVLDANSVVEQSKLLWMRNAASEAFLAIEAGKGLGFSCRDELASYLREVDGDLSTLKQSA